MSKQETVLSIISLLLVAVLIVILLGTGWFAIFRVTGTIRPVICSWPAAGQDRLLFYRDRLLPLASIQAERSFLGTYALVTAVRTPRKAVTVSRGDQTCRIYYQATLCSLPADNSAAATAYSDLVAVSFSRESGLQNVSIRPGIAGVRLIWQEELPERTDYIFELPSQYSGSIYDFALAESDLVLAWRD